MDELKSKLHELIDSSNDAIFLENIYRAFLQQARLTKRNSVDNFSSEELSELNEPVIPYRSSNKPKDFLDELSPAQLAELHKANAQYERGETIPHEEIIEKYRKRWERK